MDLLPPENTDNNKTTTTKIEREETQQPNKISASVTLNKRAAYVLKVGLKVIVKMYCNI